MAGRGYRSNSNQYGGANDNKTGNQYGGSNDNKTDVRFGGYDQQQQEPQQPQQQQRGSSNVIPLSYHDVVIMNRSI